MVIYVDIDETIYDYDINLPREYHRARPIDFNIAKINKLYDEGNEIIYYTARSSVSTHRRNEYTELTKQQLVHAALSKVTSDPTNDKQLK